jgi:hypothetical protein
VGKCVYIGEISSVQGDSKLYDTAYGGGWGDALAENVNKGFFFHICHH